MVGQTSQWLCAGWHKAAPPCREVGQQSLLPCPPLPSSHLVVPGAPLYSLTGNPAITDSGTPWLLGCVYSCSAPPGAAVATVAASSRSCLRRCRACCRSWRCVAVSSSPDTGVWIALRAEAQKKRNENQTTMTSTVLRQEGQGWREWVRRCVYRV